MKSTTVKSDVAAPQVFKRPAYDPNNLHPRDAEARKHDDTSEGIDWDEIMATTQDDFLAGRFSYNSVDYPTEAVAEVGLRQWLGSILERVLKREAAAASALNAPRR